MLIWVLALYGFIYALRGGMSKALAVQGALAAGFLAFMLITSNPFARLPIVAPEGVGLNPLLQDIGLALHPPMLYLGYIGFSLVFAIAIGALLHEDLSDKTARDLKKYCVLAWSFLTLGIGLGSWWAYRELGWGGYWFWDPVENASLIPWLCGTALLHSLLVTEKLKMLKKWSVLLAIITFIASMIGFFLVRSGVLTSVHAFATSPERGMFILALLVFYSVAALTIYGAKVHVLKSEKSPHKLTRETIVLYNNLLLTVIAATVLLGTIYPILAEAFGVDGVSVGPPYFNITTLPMLIFLLFLSAIGQKLNWVNDGFKALANRVLFPAIGAVVLSVTIIALFPADFYVSIALFAASFLVFVVAADLRKDKKRAKQLPMMLAHFGFALIALGIIFSSVFNEELEAALKPSDKIQIAGFDVEFAEVKNAGRENYLYRQGVFNVSRSGESLGTANPESRYYPVENDRTVEADIIYYILSDLYFIIGDGDAEGKYAVNIYFKPLVNLIWIGCALMFIGGIMRYFTKRFGDDK